MCQYWFFYAYNNWRSGFHGVNDHESDWELVSVYLYERDGLSCRSGSPTRRTTSTAQTCGAAGMTAPT